MKQKIYKLISMVLAVALIVSCCTVALSVTAEDTAKEPITYYVSPEGEDGDGRGLEVDKPLASVNAAVLAAKEANYGAGDTVNVKVIYIADQSSTWGETRQITAHEFTLDISSYGDSIAQLGAADTGMQFNGPTKLSNIKMLWGRSSGDKGYPAVDFAGNDVVIGSGVYTNNAEYNLFYANRGTYTKDQSLTMISAFGSAAVYLGGDWGGPTYDNNTLNITTAGTDSYSFSVRTANGNSAGHATKFNGTINFNLKSGTTKITFDSNANRVKYGENSAIQIINSVGADVSTWNENLSTNSIKPAKYFIINNSNGADAIEFTETAGKFKLNLDASKYWNIRLVNADESVVVYPDENNCVTIPESGVYTLKAGDVVTYYVKPDADSSMATGEYEKPFQYIEQAIEAAYNAKYGEGDIVNLKLIKATATVEDETVEVNHFWSKQFTGDSTNKSQAHAFKLNISSASATDKVTISTGKVNIGLGGPTNFENVILNFQYTKDDSTTANARLILHNNDLSLGTGVEYIGSPSFVAAWGSGNRENIEYYFESMPSNLRIGGRWNGGIVYTNVNVTLNGAAISRTFTLGDEGGSRNVFEGLLNFNIKDATSFALAKSGGLTFAEGFTAQVINSTGVEAISSNALTYFSGMKLSTYDSTTKTYTATENTVPYYIINNRHGADAIESTSTAGKFKVNLNPDEYSYIGLVNEDDQDITAELDENGYINIATPGVYTLKAVKEVTYYVSAGAAENGNGTPEAPFATVAEAVALANTKNYGAGVTVNLKATGSITWGTLEAYPYTLKVTSADVVNLASVSVGTVTGDLVFDDIKVTNSSRILLYGYNLTFGEGVNNTSSNISIELADAGQTVTKTQTVIINNAYKSSMVIGANHNNGSTWNKDVNVVVNNPEAVLTSISFQTYWGGEKTIKGNLNFIFNNIKSVTFGTPNGTSPAPRDYSTVVNGAVQLVVPETATITNKANLSTNWAISKGYKYHEVVKATGVKADITQTATAGKYLVDIDTGLYSNIQLVNNADETKKSDLEDGTVIASEPGEYTLKATKDTSATCTYYVSPNGSDTADGRTADTALESINAAIIAATNDGYGAGNTVLIKLIKVDDLRNKWFSASNIPSDNMKRLATHDFKINISSYTDKAILSASTHLSLGGNTEFENVILGFSTSGETYLNFLNNNVSIGQGVEYIENSKLAFATSWAGTPPQEMNYYFESIPKDLYLGGNWSGQKFNNINITLNNGFSGNIFLGERGYNSNSTTTFDGILNFNVMDAKKLGLYSTNYGPVVFTENFVMQMINSSGVEAVSTNAINYIGDKIVKDTTDTTVPYYVINNNTTNKDLIEFTDVAGTYNVNGLPEGQRLCIYNKDTKELTTTTESTFTVTSGEYEVWVEKDINGDLDIDIRDLVFASENIDTEDASIIIKADRDADNAITANDIAAIRKDLLGIKE